MQVLLVAGLGVATVLVGILIARLHPFLALLLASTLVLVLTPQTSWLRSELSNETFVVSKGDDDAFKSNSPISNGDYRLWKRDKPLPSPSVVKLKTQPATDGNATLLAIDNDGSSAEIAGTLDQWQPGDRIVSHEAYERLLDRWDRDRIGTITKRLSKGLSATFLKIGLAIAMAAIVGVCLLESGAASKLVQGLSRCFGEQRTAPTLLVSGFMLGVPIFFDTVFYLLLPLAKAFGQQRPKKALLAIMSIIVGATMAHSLVPPTPGPLLVANQLGISIGSMMLGGLIVGGTAACFGFLYSVWCNRTVDFRLEGVGEAKALHSMDRERRLSRNLPLWAAALPLVVPILFLGGIEISGSLGFAWADKDGSHPVWWLGCLDLFTDSGFVLMIAAVIAYILLRRVLSAKETTPLMTLAVADAGTIILLTCAGGAFGSALEQLRIAEAVTQLSANLITPHGLLFAAFFLTGIIRIAQGSATIAMITSVGIVAPFVQSRELPFHPVYVALSIGCGSKLMPWMNDSGFWQVSTMTGLNTSQTLRTFSVALTLMGIVGFTVTLFGAWLLPMK
jgi:GntP family gluconate:H+ symporter